MAAMCAMATGSGRPFLFASQANASCGSPGSCSPNISPALAVLTVLSRLFSICHLILGHSRERRHLCRLRLFFLPGIMKIAGSLHSLRHLAWPATIALELILVNSRTMGYKPIEDYGIIGDLNTAALVAQDGSIDFMCFPRFDSPSIFAALLDDQRGGRFTLAPEQKDVRLRQSYLPDSNVLLTRFLTQAGVAEVSDFMAITHLGHAHDLVRRAKVVRGQMRFRMSCQPRFDYARAKHRIEARPNEVLFISEGPDQTVLRLRTDVPVQIEAGAATASFELSAGQTAAFVLEDATVGSDSKSSNPDYVSESFKETINFGRAGCANAITAAAGAKWCTVPPSPSSCSPARSTGPLWPRPPSGCLRNLAARGTGTIASPGSGMLPSRSTRSCAWATVLKQQPSCVGSKRAAGNSTRAIPCR